MAVNASESKADGTYAQICSTHLTVSLKYYRELTISYHTILIPLIPRINYGTKITCILDPFDPSILVQSSCSQGNTTLTPPMAQTDSVSSISFRDTARMEDLYRDSSPDFDFSTYRNSGTTNKVRPPRDLFRKIVFTQKL